MNKGKILIYLIISIILLIIIVPIIIFSGWRTIVVDTITSSYQWALGNEGQVEAGFYYTCPMHPQINLPQPGDCPICGMSLVKKSSSAKAKEGRPAEIILTPTQIQLANIHSEEIKERHLIKEIDTVGRIDYDERKIAYVAARVEGRIDKLLVDFTGLTIQKGHSLVSLYSPQLISAQEEYLRALKTLKEISASQTTAPAKNAGNLVESTRQRLIWWGITEQQIDQLKKTNQVQEHLTIKAPIGGTVIHKNAFEGMYVKEGTQLFKIVDMSNMWLYADIYEFEVPLLLKPQAGDYYQCPMHAEIKQNKPGDCSKCGMPLIRHSPGLKVEITTESYPDEVFTGEIEFTDPFVNPRTRTLRIRCSIKNPDLKLRAEMYARARLLIDIGQIPALPENAVIESGKRNIIFIDQGNGLYEPRLIKLGSKWLYEKGKTTTSTTALPFHRGMQRYHEILDGLNTKEKIVNPANFLLNSEAQIQGALEKFLATEKPQPKPQPEKVAYEYCAWEGMKMKKSAFQSTMEYEGKTLYFCTPEEMEKFMKEPKKSHYYKSKQPKQPKKEKNQHHH